MISELIKQFGKGRVCSVEESRGDDFIHPCSAPASCLVFCPAPLLPPPPQSAGTRQQPRQLLGFSPFCLFTPLAVAKHTGCKQWVFLQNMKLPIINLPNCNSASVPPRWCACGLRQLGCCAARLLPTRFGCSAAEDVAPQPARTVIPTKVQ